MRRVVGSGKTSKSVASVELEVEQAHGVDEEEDSASNSSDSSEVS